jgi:hypothetical protein
MDHEGIIQLLKDVQGPNVKIKKQGEWVMSHCPFARWTHDRGTDAHMSFGVKINHYDKSKFNCFSCKIKGTLSWMLKRLSEYNGESYKGLIDEVETDEVLGTSLPEWDRRFSHDSVNDPLGPPVSEDYLDVYDDAAGHWYLKERGIARWATEELDLRVDPDDRGAERILFPVYSHDGGFYGYTSRAVEKGIEPRVRDYFGLPKRKLLLGSEFIQDIDDYLILVEGLFDFAKLYQYGYPVVAVMHSSLTPEQARILKDLNKRVVVMFDNDKAGLTGRGIVRQELVKHVPLQKVRYPGRFPFGKGDPALLKRDEVEQMLGEARLL